MKKSQSKTNANSQFMYVPKAKAGQQSMSKFPSFNQTESDEETKGPFKPKTSVPDWTFLDRPQTIQSQKPSPSLKS
jgi:hypothetical protein